jgi:adenylylsulfate kinase
MHGCVIWLTGLPSSGKSTLATHVAERLRRDGQQVAVLDSDAVRDSLVPSLGYDQVDRANFYETLARLAAMLAKQGLVVLVAATAHRAQFRARARSLAPRWIEVFLDAPEEVCRARDPKGLWSAETSSVRLPGAGEPYEAPTDPDVRVEHLDSIEQAIARIVEALAEDEPPVSTW